MRVRVRGRGIGSRDRHCLSGRDAGYGFRDGISRDLSIFPRFSHFLLFLMTLGSRGARSASRDSKLSLGWRILSIFKVTMLNTCDPARKCKIIQGFWANVAFSPGWMLGLGFNLNLFSVGWFFDIFHPLRVNSLQFWPLKNELFPIFTLQWWILCNFYPLRTNSWNLYAVRVNFLHFSPFSGEFVAFCTL